MRLRNKWWTGLLLTPLVGASALAKEGTSFDAFLQARDDKPLAVAEEGLRSRGMQVQHQEERLGVPTFLWSTTAHAGPTSGALTSSQTPEEAAREHLRSLADVYRLSAADMEGVQLKSVHQPRFGPLIARFTQTVEGIEVFRNELNVVMNRNQELVAVSGYLAPTSALQQARLSGASSFQLSAEQAIVQSFQRMSGLALPASSLQSLGRTGGDASSFFTFDSGYSRLLTWEMGEPARARRVWFTLPDRLEPAWYVELDAGARGAGTDYMAFVVSAADGSLLMQHSLTESDSFKYRVWADSTTLKPHDGPQGTENSPHPTGVPDNFQPAGFIAPSYNTLSNYPFSRNDPWLPAGAVQTVGNNADAYADLAAPDGYQPETDLRPSITAPGEFDYTFDTSLAPNANPTQIKASTVNLFYLNNFLHDWYYDYGFDEAAGNGQVLNYGRGGIEGDSIKAEAQDYGGRNNANMSTPSDGGRPRMQMYIFDGVPLAQLSAPDVLKGKVDIASASFGATSYNLSGDVKILNTTGTTLACDPLPANTFSGKIALLDRGTCSFAIKAAVAQAAGATAVVIANNADALSPIALGGTDPTITLPTVSITKARGDAWKAEAAKGSTLTLSLTRTPNLDRDGTLDNDIISHEWGHYISNRLIGNSSGLVNNQGRSMGEGWADFHALLLQVRESDRSRPGNDHWQGVYALAAYTQAGGGNNGYYFGIRRAPYSTDMSKNGLTFKHFANGTPLPTTFPLASGQAGLTNSEVHNGGEIWASMLWECYASLLNAYPFQDAQDRMKFYLLAAYKATPLSPTLLEARDAVLAAAAATDASDYLRFRTAFAKRGAGMGAKAPDRNSQDHIGVVESFAAGNNLEVVSARLDDSVTACDQDGILDRGETGLLTLTVRNSGASALAAFNGAVSASGATATLAFPAGTSLSFPALQPNQTATRTLRVSLSAITGTTPTAGLKVTFDEPSLPPTAQTFTYEPRVDYDEVPASASVDTAEGSAGASVWTSSYMGSVLAWSSKGSDGSRYYHVDDQSTVSDLTFTTPWMRVKPSGDFILSFKTRWSFESTNGAAPFYDGGVLEYTLDDVTWTDVPLTTTVLDATPVSQPNPLAGRKALAGLSSSYPAWLPVSLNFKSGFADKQVRFRFRAGSDSGTGAYGWDLDDITFTNTVTPPFNALVPEQDSPVCNRRPIAQVGANKTVDEGVLSSTGTLVRTVVTLDGSGSFDPDGSPIIYSWKQVGGPTATLSSASVAQPTFTADVPAVPATSVLTFQLTVSDGIDSSLPKQVQIFINNVNRPPVAVATGPVSVDERSTAKVMLDGSGSSDADGEAITYLWTQTAGPAVTLDSTTIAKPSFSVPEVTADTVFTFSLVVSDGLASSKPATVSVTVRNVDRPPLANAGTAQTVDARSTVTLLGSGSDPDGDVITYAWTQVGGPLVSLMNPTTPSPSFTAPDIRGASVDLTFQLVTSSNGLSSTPSTVKITVRKLNRRPIVTGPGAIEANEREYVTLSVTGTDPDGQTLTWQWTQTGGPTLSTFSGGNSPSIGFTAPEVLSDTLFTFQVVATDPDGASSDPVTVSLKVKNVDRPPLANAGAAQDVDANSLVTLQGTGSDPDGDAITYSWTQVGGRLVSLMNPTTASPSFTAPTVSGTPVDLTFQLVTSSNGLSSTPSTVKVTVHKLNRRPIVTGPGAIEANEREYVTLSVTGTDPDGQALTWQWTQTGGPTLSTFSGGNSPSIGFTAPEVLSDTLFTFRVVATDPDGASSDPVTVSLKVKNVDRPPLANAGTAQNVDSSTLVTLQGTGSDPDGDAITYSWTQVGGPPVSLMNPTTASPSFTAPAISGASVDLTFQLVTSSNGLSSAPSTVKITVHKINHRPIATGPNFVEVNERESITLDATGTDPDGQALTWHWTQTGGPVLSGLTGIDTPTLGLTAPEVQVDTLFSFQVVATDPDGASSDPVTVSLKVKNVDRAPVANAGTAQDVDARSLVTLLGTGSDPDGDTVHFAWTQVGGPTVSLLNATTVSPSFTAPDITGAPVELTFQLVASANGLSSAPSLVKVTVHKLNRRPIVSGPGALEVNEHESTTLTATGTDPDGQALTWQWTQTGGPTLSGLTGINTPTLGLTAPEVQVDTLFTFQVVATDPDGASSDPVTVSLKVKNVDRAPVVNAGAAQSVDARSLVTLQGTGSDPDGDPVSFTWTQVGGPLVSLMNPTTLTPSFTAPDVRGASAELTFQLVASANGLPSAPSLVKVTVNKLNRRPIVSAPGALEANEREYVTLIATGTDPDDQAITWQWTQTGGPVLTGLTGTNSPSLGFIAPEVQTDTLFTFQVVATDTDGAASAPVTVSLEVKNVSRAPLANAGTDQDVNARSPVILLGSGLDLDGEAVTYAWTQVGGPTVDLKDATTSIPSFTAPDIRGEPVVLTFQLVASAHGLSSAPSTVKVTVHKLNRTPVVKGPSALEVNERESITLDATGSDEDGQALTWHWTQTGGPQLTAVTGGETASLTFTAPDVLGDTLVSFSVQATDTDGAPSDPVLVSVKIKDVNRAPVAKARQIGGGEGGQLVALDASGSEDPDGDVLTYHWTQVSGTAVTLQDGDTATPSFTAPQETTTLVFEVTVTDRSGSASKAQVSVDIAQAQAPATGCSSAGSAPGSFGVLLLLGAGALFSRRRLTGRA